MREYAEPVSTSGRWEETIPMSIRTKIGVILLCAVICFSVAQYCVQRFIILPGFISLERDEAITDADRVSKAIKNEIKHLNTLSWDWSAWDDTYDFVQSRAKAYIDSNLVLSTFTGNHLNLIYICDLQGRVVWGKIYDLSTEKEVQLDLFPKDFLPRKHPLLIRDDASYQPESDIRGVMVTEAGPVVVSATPILKSNNEGPPRGTLIMGRFLNTDMVMQIAAQTQVDFSLAVFPDLSTRRELVINKETPYEVEVVDGDYLNVRSIFPAINGNPVIAITTNFQRKISRKGYDTVQNGIYSILFFGMGILILILLSLKYSILNPISRLNNHIFSIKKTGDLSKRLVLSRNDEIGTLADEFDNMASRLEKSAIEKDQINKQLRKDIEKRKQAETALMESEERFRTMIDQAGDAVFLHDVKGNFKIINQAACKLLGYEKSMLLSLSMVDVDPDAVRQRDSNDSWKNINHNKTVVSETRYQCMDGTFIPVEVSLTSIRYSGENLILSFARDVTERKQMDDQVRQSQKMEAIMTLTAGIAHNFNNILSVIVGSAELAIARLPKDNQAAKLLKRVEDASARAKEIVWQLIRFSHKNESRFSPVQAHAVVEKEIKRMESIIPDEVKIIKQLKEDCYPLLGDDGQLRVMMENLLTNAVESIKNNRGVIEVQLENISGPDAANVGNINSKNGKFIRLTIRDNGQGIDPSHMGRIFDPYFTTKDFSNGAGMGLSVVHGIVTNNGGTITVDSKVGRGTEIRIFFPAAEPAGEILN